MCHEGPKRSGTIGLIRMAHNLTTKSMQQLEAEVAKTLATHLNGQMTRRRDGIQLQGNPCKALYYLEQPQS